MNFNPFFFSDIAEEVSDDVQSESATRMGRFRICPPNAPGPPDTSHGRFRISSQGMFAMILEEFI